jgi:pyrroloquinoline-quinone synthase
MSAKLRSASVSEVPWDPVTFKARLMAKEARYHIHHPFNVRMQEGGLSPEQIRGWVANRFYYQLNIPQKDAAIVSNCPDREVRQLWTQRIQDHDGGNGKEGGIEAWTRLGEAVGISRDELWSLRQVVPGVRFAVDAYLNFARRSSWQEGVCASLTEMFAPKIHRDRLVGWPRHYPWIEADGLDYFRSRIALAERDVEHGMQVTIAHFVTRADQERALDILQFKLDVLWSMMNAIEYTYS